MPVKGVAMVDSIKSEIRLMVAGLFFAQCCKSDNAWGDSLYCDGLWCCVGLWPAGINERLIS